MQPTCLVVDAHSVAQILLAAKTDGAAAMAGMSRRWVRGNLYRDRRAPGGLGVEPGGGVVVVVRGVFVRAPRGDTNVYHMVIFFHFAKGAVL
jgi:hypothetical protein